MRLLECKTHATVRDQPLTDWPLTGKEKPLTESTAKQRPEAQITLIT